MEDDILSGLAYQPVGASDSSCPPPYQAEEHPRSPQAAKPIFRSHILHSKKQSRSPRAASIKMNFPFFGPSSLLEGLSVDRGELCHFLPLLGGNY